jgi:hypothetical protein
MFTNYDNADYSPIEGGFLAGKAVLLAGYTTALDAATTWGSETTTPVIVTKENTGLYCGAITR